MHDGPDIGDSATAGRSARRRWQWYHFYFLLALFDVIVIVATLVLHHRTLKSYEVALGELGTVDAKQRWVDDMRMAVMALSSPGNDVFVTRRVDQERRRASETMAMLNAQMGHRAHFGVDLSRLETLVDSLVTAQQGIFESLESLESKDISVAEEQDYLEQASVHMAIMDRRTADAFNALAVIERTLIREQNRLHEAYGQSLEHRAFIEKCFFVMVILILVGVLYYGRMLQQKQEQMEINLRRADHERRERLAAIGELCGAVAHGIRNPLAAITSSAQLALEFGSMDERTRTHLEDVIVSAERLNRRSTRLLRFSQEGRPKMERFDLSRQVGLAVQELMPRIDELGLVVETELEPSVQVFGDRDRIVQSVIEIVSNAMDCLPRGGRIRIVCQQDPRSSGHVLIGVLDNGPGIPEHLRRQVFDLFFSSKPDGTGVGLASVKRAIDLHQGEVEVAPNEGGGTHVCIRLPADA